jgi:hypothetical protein
VKIEFVFSLILGYKVTIRKITNSISKGIKATEINLVGNIMLGLDSICGSDFIEQENHFEISGLEADDEFWDWLYGFKPDNFAR